jgi:hypothetical protein
MVSFRVFSLVAMLGLSSAVNLPSRTAYITTPNTPTSGKASIPTSFAVQAAHNIIAMFALIPPSGRPTSTTTAMNGLADSVTLVVARQLATPTIATSATPAITSMPALTSNWEVPLPSGFSTTTDSNGNKMLYRIRTGFPGSSTTNGTSSRRPPQVPFTGSDVTRTIKEPEPTDFSQFLWEYTGLPVYIVPNIAPKIVRLRHHSGRRGTIFAVLAALVALFGVLCSILLLYLCCRRSQRTHRPNYVLPRATTVSVSPPRPTGHKAKDAAQSNRYIKTPAPIITQQQGHSDQLDSDRPGAPIVYPAPKPAGDDGLVREVV